MYKLILSTGLGDIADRDMNIADIVWTIKWESIVRDYKSDLDTYIWQPHRYPPPFAYARVFISTNNVPCVPRTLILFSSTRLLQSFRQQYESTSAMFKCIRSSAIGLLHGIYAIYRVAINEMKDFLQDVSRQIFDMVGIPASFPADADTTSIRLFRVEVIRRKRNSSIFYSLTIAERGPNWMWLVIWSSSTTLLKH